MLRVGVLASGGGTNLQAILDACAAGRVDAEVVVVLSDKPAAGALERARKAGLPAHFVDPAGKLRGELDEAMVRHLKEAGAELVCLAGYLRIVTKVMLDAFPERVVNVHPALLPSFPGLHAQRRAWEHGVRITGCTTHIVDEEVDHGPILLQAAVPILEGDEVEDVEDRILREEHVIYPATIQLFAEGRVRVEGRRAIIAGTPVAGAGVALRNPPA